MRRYFHRFAALSVQKLLYRLSEERRASGTENFDLIADAEMIPLLDQRAAGFAVIRPDDSDKVVLPDKALDS